MLQRRILLSTRAIFSSSTSAYPCRLTTLPLHRPPLLQPPLTTTSTRPASHAAQGRANKAAPGPGKRLGAKKGDSELVVPGNIIFRQRGTHWFPGENCGMGRDHTIFALQKGFVRYYRDPDVHKERKFIGVVFEQEQRLPRGRGSARRRRLGLMGREMVVEMSGDGGLEEQAGSVVGEILGVEVKDASAGVAKTTGYIGPSPPNSSSSLSRSGSLEGSSAGIRPKYQFRTSNYEIGRVAERADVKVRPYKPNDRFLAWRKRTARLARNAEKRSLRGKVQGDRRAKKRK